MQPARSRGRTLGQQLPEPLFLGIGRRDHPHLLILADRFQFLADPVEHAGEPLHTLDGQKRRRLQARRRHGGERHRGESVDLGEYVGWIRDRRRTDRPGGGICQELMRSGCLLGNLAGLNQDPPRTARHDVGQLCPPRRQAARAQSIHHPFIPHPFIPYPFIPHEGRQVDGIKRVDAPLADGIEGAQRLDLIAEQFNADGTGPVGREEVEDAATPSERAGGLDGISRLPAPRHQPVGKLCRIELASRGEAACAGLDLTRVGQRRQQGLDGGHDDPRLFGRRADQSLDQSQSLRRRRISG